MAFGALAAIGLGASLYSAYNQYEAGKDAQETANQRANLLAVQAEEVLERGLINRELFAEQGQRVLGAQTTAFAKSGADVGSGSPLLAAQYTANAIADELINMSRETEYEALAIRNEAQFTRNSGADARRAGRLQSFGTILGGGVAAAKASK